MSCSYGQVLNLSSPVVYHNQFKQKLILSYNWLFFFKTFWALSMSIPVFIFSLVLFLSCFVCFALYREEAILRPILAFQLHPCCLSIIMCFQLFCEFDVYLLLLSAGFTFLRALGQDEIQGPQHKLICRKIINIRRNFEQLWLNGVD